MSQPRVLPSLTPLRGIAALWVVLYHYNDWAPNLSLDNYLPVVSRGYLAVDLFLVMSGFVMTHVYRHDFMESLSGHYVRFLGARVARLYPLHLFILLLFVLTALLARLDAGLATGTFKPIPVDGARSLVALLANLVMLQGLKASALSWDYPSWSISVEFIAYLLFPVLFVVICRVSNGAKFVLAGVVVAALVYLRQMTGDNFDQWDGALTFLRCLPEFFAGVLLYELFQTGAWQRPFASDVTAGVVLALVAFLLEGGLSDFLAVLSLMVLVPVSVANAGVVTKALNVKPLLWLGEISYSLYLVHGLVQFVAERLLAIWGITNLHDVPQLTSSLMVGTMMMTSLLVASLTYATIERLGRDQLRKAFDRLRSPAERRPPVGSGNHNGLAPAQPRLRPTRKLIAATRAVK